MFLRSLTLKGFKSFADTTTLDFEPGITVVVGPNGSGKSNVVDAVAWVLGAQGPRTLRSSKMEDVIFAGSAKRAPLGRAEVSLTIDNSSGILPIGFTEVTITRTLFRNGDSEYAINGAPVRLLDVQELLSDSGVGRQQHVIVSQGQLDAVLNARPEDRRAIVEEAAGVLKYRKRRERSQRRLEATEANFVRLSDLLREIRRQLRPLERQAEAARKHDEYSAELRAIRLFLLGRELFGLRTRAESAARQQSELRTVEAATRSRLAALDADVVQAEATLSALSGGGAGPGAEDPFAGVDLGEALARTEAAHQKARGLVALLAERRRSIERDRTAFLDEDVVATLENEAARLVADIEAVERDASALPPRFEELRAAEAAHADERAQFLDEWGADTAPPAGAVTAAAVRTELAAARQAVDGANRQIDRVDARLRALAERAERLEIEAGSAGAELAALDDALGGDGVEAAAAVRVEAEARLAAAEIAAEEAGDAHRDAEGDQRGWQARVEALSAALDEARARAGAQRLAGLDGIVGTLLDLVAVDAGWEAAFESAVGEALASVIVSDIGAARAALADLRARNLSGAVLALGAPALASSRPLLHEIGEPVRNHVRSSNPDVERALDTLLSNAVAVAGSWDAALDLALAHPALVVVTAQGDRFGATGWRTGAGSSGATGAALGEARSRLTASEAAADAARIASTSARAAVESARLALDGARDEEHAATTARDRRAARRAALVEIRSRVAGDHDDVAAEDATLRQQREELAASGLADELRAARLEASLPALVSAEAEVAAREGRRREATQRLDARAHAVGALRTDLEVRAAGIDERRRMLSSRQAEIDARLLRHRAEREAAEGRRLELVRRSRHTEGLHALVSARVTVLEAGLSDLRERRRRQSEAARQATLLLDGLRKERVAAEHHLGETRERLQRADLESAELRMRLENAVEQLRREFDVEPSVAIAAEGPVLPAGTSAPTRVRELERDLRLLGPINPLALEEHAGLQERHTLIEAQLDDVKRTRRELNKVIRAIDDEIVTIFSSAQADVAENFEKLFGLLFPGGFGRLRLTDPENLLDTGIEVEARPSGKNVKKLSLLSGGERSLTALAFLFAVFRSRPSPFYLLDEVEAALDDVNLQRFLGLMEEFRGEAQLVVVSHQKRTMEAADCLYGVTMQPGGSSKVVSEKVEAVRS